MKNKYIYSLIILLAFCGLFGGCSAETLEKDSKTVEGEGITYTFRLPKGWKKQENFQDRYGRQAVFGSEDTRSNSGMFILIFSKDKIDRAGFGEETRKELAQKNGYQEVNDVYMKEYKINEVPAYKYTFETKFNGKKMWAHFYCIFSENGVIQLMFYSADDANYKKRVERIDEAVSTVKETGFDQTNVSSEANENRDEITLNHNQFVVTMTGIAKISSDIKQPLLVIRYEYKNKSGEKKIPHHWADFIQVKQENQLLQEANFPTKSKAYEIKELVENSNQEVLPNETIQGVLLYELRSTETVQMTFLEGIDSNQPSYTLVIPS